MSKPSLAKQIADSMKNGTARFVGPLSAKGIGRDPDNEQVLFASFDRRPTDDEMRAIHDLLRKPFT